MIVGMRDDQLRPPSVERINHSPSSALRSASFSRAFAAFHFASCSGDMPLETHPVSLWSSNTLAFCKCASYASDVNVVTSSHRVNLPKGINVRFASA